VNVHVLLLFTMVVIVVAILALTMHCLIAFRSPTASLPWRDLWRTSPRGVEVIPLELGHVLRRASDVAVGVVSVGDLSSMLNGKCLPSFVIFCCLGVD
jgi:hypothetical protein